MTLARLTARLTAGLTVLLTVVAGCAAPAHRAAQDAVTVIRFGVIVSGGGAELPETLVRTGIAQRYGLKIETVPYASPGQQYTLVRGGSADIVPGNVLDLERQRRAGLGLVAVGAFQRFSSPVVVPPDSPLTSFADLRGRRVGQFGPTTIDWLTLRTAGLLATGLDLNSARLTQAAPPLLSALLHRGQLDAAMQFASLAAAPIALHQERALTTVPALLTAAHLDPDALDVVWSLHTSWRTAHPGALGRLQAAMREAYARLKSGDRALWAPLVSLVGITDPGAVRAYMAEEIATMDPPFRPDVLAPTQRLIDAIIGVAGREAVGFTTLPAADFAFPSG